MKPNGNVVRVVLLVLLSVTLLSVFGQAQTTHGSFTLLVEAYWGKMLLSPGAYQFTVTDGLPGKIVTVRSTASGLSGMIMSLSASDLRSDKDTKLMLEKSATGVYVRALCLGDSGVMLNYEAP